MILRESADRLICAQRMGKKAIETERDLLKILKRVKHFMLCLQCSFEYLSQFEWA